MTDISKAELLAAIREGYREVCDWLEAETVLLALATPPPYFPDYRRTEAALARLSAIRQDKGSPPGS